MICERLLRICAVSCLVFVSPGCNKNSSAPQNENERHQAADLKLFIFGYQNIHDADGAPPSGPERLLENISSDRPIEFDSYVIIWSVDFGDVTDHKNTVLAYVKDVPTNGGMVGFADGSVRRVSADEFKTLAKAIPTNMSEKQADYSLTAKEFSDEFQKDNNAASQKYKNKIVELKGKVVGFESSSDFDPPKSFKDRVMIGSGMPGDAVLCFTFDAKPWMSYTKGQAVTVKGRVPFPQGYIHIRGCAVIPAEPNKLSPTTANALAKEFAENVEAAGAKYGDKSLIVTGEVVREERERFSLKVTLKGDPKTSIVCKFNGGGREKVKQFKPGDKVKFYGEYERLDSGNIVLEKCQLIGD